MYEKSTCEISIPTRVLYLLLGLILLVGSACSSNSSDQINSTRTSYPVQPNETEPPILLTNTLEPSILVSIDNPNTTLTEHQWVLSAIYYREENKHISALKPTYFQFNIKRNLLLVTTPCEGTDDSVIGYGFDILFLEEQHYILAAQDSIMPNCGEMIDIQTEYLRILDTSQYEIQDEQLILTGKNIQIVLENDDANP